MNQGKKIFLHFYTVGCFYSHMFTCMSTKQWQEIIFSAQSGSLGTQNYSFLLRNHSDSIPNTKWYFFSQHSWDLLYYLLFLILSSSISFLCSILSFFVSDSMSFSYSPILFYCVLPHSNIKMPLSSLLLYHSIQVYLILSAPSHLSCRGTMFFSHLGHP